MSDITLEIPLGLLSFGGCWQRNDAADARVQELGDAFDDAAFAGRIASLKKYHYLQAFVFNPFLELHQFDLEFEQGFFITRVADLLFCRHTLLHIVKLSFRERGGMFSEADDCSRSSCREFKRARYYVPEKFSFFPLGA